MFSTSRESAARRGQFSGGGDSLWTAGASELGCASADFADVAGSVLVDELEGSLRHADPSPARSSMAVAEREPERRV